MTQAEARELQLAAAPASLEAVARAVTGEEGATLGPWSVEELARATATPRPEGCCASPGPR